MNDLENLGICAAEIKELVQAGTAVPLCVTGSSMMPFLRPCRDVVWLKEAEESSFKVGDILLFERSDGSLVLHRVRKLLHGGRLLMNGDALTECEVIERAQVIASVFEITAEDKKIRCDSFGSKLQRILWHPTLKIRPYLKKMRSAFFSRRK